MHRFVYQLSNLYDTGAGDSVRVESFGRVDIATSLRITSDRNMNLLSTNTIARDS
jgi:hypothetical protein